MAAAGDTDALLAGASRRARAYLAGLAGRDVAPPPEATAALAKLDFPLPAGLIHGDAHIGNLMRSASGQVILGDWDHVATGPREWDLVQIHYIHRRFGRAADEDINAFTTSYGWDIRDWPGLETLIAVREITGLSAHIRTAPYKPFTREQLAYRLDTLRRGETTARWLSPPG